MLKEQKGITLVALVITIIVLLILAGVSIAALSGQNGILTNASSAKAQTTRENAAEKIRIALQAAKTQALVEINSDNNFDPTTDVEAVKKVSTEAILGIKTSDKEGTGTYTVTPIAGKLTITFVDNNNKINIKGDITFNTENPSGLISTVSDVT